jgi:hypothetical protein
MNITGIPTIRRKNTFARLYCSSGGSISARIG